MKNKYTKFIRSKNYAPTKKAADKIGKMAFGTKFQKVPSKSKRTEI